MLREISLDTETTGMEPATGDRMVEIGAVELINHVPTGKNYHVYLNPERDIPPEAVAVHGLTEEFLADKPLFSQVFPEFLDFLGADSQLVIHNAEFDMKFINAELKSVGHPGIKMDRVMDSVKVARKKFPGSPANLDALCRRFDIDLSGRELHGALLDAQLLADVWLELNGGRQRGLEIEADGQNHGSESGNVIAMERTFREPRRFEVPKEELQAHEALLEKLKDPLWRSKA